MNLLWKWEGDKIIKFWTKSSTFKIIFSLTRFEATNKRRHTFLALEEAWPPWAESQEASLCLSPKSKYFCLNFEVLFWTTMQKPFFFILGNTFVPVLSLIPRFPLFRWQGCLAKSGCKKWKNILRCKKLSEEFQLVDWPKFCCPGQVSGEPKGVPCPTLRASSQSPPDHISYFKHLLDPASYFKSTCHQKYLHEKTAFWVDGKSIGLWRLVPNLPWCALLLLFNQQHLVNCKGFPIQLPFLSGQVLFQML